MVRSLSARKHEKFRLFIDVQILLMQVSGKIGDGSLPFSYAKQVFRIIRVSSHGLFNQVAYNQLPNGMKIDRPDRKFIAKVMLKGKSIVTESRLKRLTISQARFGLISIGTS